MSRRRPGWTGVRRALPALLLAAGACTATAADRLPEQRAATAPVAVEIAPGELSRLQGIAVGREDAPVVIYEFADFQCPACAQFASFVTPYIKQRHVEAGTVRYVHYDFPLIGIHPHAFVTARAARCANEQGRFWEYHDLLYAEQRSWSQQEEVLPLLGEYAQSLGLDRGAFDACLLSDRYAAEVSKHMKLGESLGVPGTPTLFVNGKRAAIRSLEDLDRLIAQEAGMAN